MALDFSGSIIRGNAPMVLGCTTLRFQDLRLLDFIFLEPGVLSVEDCRFLNSKDSRHEGSKAYCFSSLTV
jgi:hypothetical protein